MPNVAESPSPPGAGASVLRWAARALSRVAFAVVAWAMITQSGAVVHGQPTYAVLLAVTLIGAAVAAWLAWRKPRRPGSVGLRRVLGWVAVVAVLGWIGSLIYLRPLTADATAVAAMASDQAVTVTESPSRVVLKPASGEPRQLGVFFQPGARVDARAYVPNLRPLAEAGYLVVIEKQPVNIAFFAVDALEQVRVEHPEITEWVVGGHSLGGTVAAIEAVAGQSGSAPVVGLFFWASYPADSIRETFTGSVESISGSRDGLATPEKIEASKADLPASTNFVVIEGACHAQFGDYGVQPGDAEPTISAAAAHDQISQATLSFVQSLRAN